MVPNVTSSLRVPSGSRTSCLEDVEPVFDITVHYLFTKFDGNALSRHSEKI